MKSGALKALAAAVRVEGSTDSLDAHRRKTLGNLLGCFRGTLGAQVKGCLDCGKRSPPRTGRRSRKPRGK